MKNLHATISRSFIGGALGGLLCAIVDLVRSCWIISSWSGRGLLLLHLLAMLPTAGALLSVATALTYRGARWGVSRFRPGLDPGRTDRALDTVITLLLSPLLFVVARKLFEGGLTSRLPARDLLIAITACGLVLGCYTLVRLSAFLIRRVAAAESATMALVGALVSFLGALMSGWMDVHLYRRLYQFLHVGLGALTLLGMCLSAFTILFLLTGGRLRRHTDAVVLALLLLLVSASAVTFGRSQAVRLVVYEHTATARNLLLTIGGLKKGHKGLFPVSPEFKQAQAERRRHAMITSNGGLLSYPGLNIILISLDALRADRLGISGSTRRLTPHIDAWARKGVIFDHAYCSTPHSSFSITSLFTSEELYALSELGPLPSLPTLTDAIKANGYFTSAFFTRGIFFTRGEKLTEYDERHFGFESARHTDLNARDLTDAAINELDGILEHESKFFLWVHYFDAHEPYTHTERGTSPEARYDSGVAFLDREVGRLLAYIDAHQERETVVVLTSDHGEEFKDHGGDYHGSSLYEEQVHVPLIWHVPGAAPHRVKGAVSLSDIAPTLLGLADIEPPPTMKGADLRPSLQSGEEPIQPVFGTVNQKKMVVLWPWKLIADLNFDFYELYNLERDPREKQNIYDYHQDKARDLKGELYAWLDDLRERRRMGQKSPVLTALDLGKLGDRRAVPMLVALLKDPASSPDDRREAVILLGRLGDKQAVPALLGLIESRDADLAAWAAVSLGQMGEARAVPFLVQSLSNERKDLGTAAALTLGQLGDRRSVPVLIEALDTPDMALREDVIKTLGYLRDDRATEPLLDLLSDLRTRYLVVLALGRIGDPKAYDALVDILEHETYTDVRGYAVAALGWIGIPEITPYLVDLLIREPEIRWTSEALVRLGAIQHGFLSGVDGRSGDRGLAKGWSHCHVEDPYEQDAYMNRTWCETRGGDATLQVSIPKDVPTLDVLRIRHLGSPDAGAKLKVLVNGQPIAEILLGSQWEEYRFHSPAGTWHPGLNKVELSAKGNRRSELHMAFDHLLVTPERSMKGP